ncbi:MAG: hypothetical protein GF308_21740 [Candidatus Heimdallarchaeota archaeon]|nr:hypothetical protein [Candidatus Heimdallarchaeota archaeon]
MKKNTTIFSLVFMTVILGISVGLTASHLIKLDLTPRTNTFELDDIDFWGNEGDDWARDVIVDSNGYVFVAGCSEKTSGGDSDIFLRKYAPDLTLVWNISWGTEEGYEVGGCIALDSEENILVTGGINTILERNGATENYAFIVKFDTDGNELANGTHYCGTNQETWWGVKAKEDGTIYTAGEIYYPMNDTSDAVYAIWDNDLTTLLTHGKWFDGTKEGRDRAESIQPTSDGGFIIVGRSNSFGSDVNQEHEGFIAKYDSSEVLEDYIIYGDDNFYQHFLEIIEDSLGNYYICGIAGSMIETSWNGAILQKYNSSLGLVWETFYDTDYNDAFYDVILGSDNNLYCAGYIEEVLNNHDVFIAKYSTTGDLLDSDIWGADKIDWGTAIAEGINNEFYVPASINSTAICSYPRENDVALLAYNLQQITSPPPSTTTPPETSAPPETTTPPETSPPDNFTTSTPTFSTTDTTDGLTIISTFLGFLGLITLIVILKKRK